MPRLRSVQPVDGDPSDIVAHHLHFAGMDPRPDLQLERSASIPDGLGSMDGAGGAVEDS